MSEETTQVEAPVEEVQAPTPQLTIADLVLSAQIVQAAASKGVFRAEELKTVGDYYDRLIRFLEASGAITRPQAPAESDPATSPTVSSQEA